MNSKYQILLLNCFNYFRGIKVFVGSWRMFCNEPVWFTIIEVGNCFAVNDI